jgi:hypothetical protein
MKNLILVFGLVALFSFNAQAQNWWKSGISGEGPIVKRTLDLSSFDKVVLTNNAKVYLRQGSSQSVEVEAQQNIIDNLVKEVSDNTWKIRFDDPVRRYDGMKVYITIPSLTGVRLSGSGSIISENTFTGIDELGVSISGSGDIRLSVEANMIDSHISGSGDIRLAGRTDKHGISISGSGEVEAYDLTSSSCKVRISGSGDCQIEVQEDLEVRISGSGDVNYKGRPRISSRISGSGDINGRS